MKPGPLETEEESKAHRFCLLIAELNLPSKKYPQPNRSLIKYTDDDMLALPTVAFNFGDGDGEISINTTTSILTMPDLDLPRFTPTSEEPTVERIIGVILWKIFSDWDTVDGTKPKRVTLA